MRCNTWHCLLSALLLAAGCQLASKDKGAEKPLRLPPAGNLNAPGSPPPPSWPPAGPRQAGATATPIATPSSGASSSPDPGIGQASLTTINPSGGLLAGQVLDRLNRRPIGASIQVVDLKETRDNPAARIEVSADEKGFFTIQGLKSGRPYQLIARTQDGKRVYSGAVVVTPPNPRLTIFLSEDLQGNEVPGVPVPDQLPVKAPTSTSGPQARLMAPQTFTYPNPAQPPMTAPIQIGDSNTPSPIATNPTGGPPVMVMPSMSTGAAAPSVIPAQPAAPVPAPIAIAPALTLLPDAPAPAPVAPVVAEPPPPASPVVKPAPPQPTVPPGQPAAVAPTAQTIPADRIARGLSTASASPLLSIPSSPAAPYPVPLPITISPAPSCVLLGNKLEQLALLDLDGKTWELTKNRKGRLVLFDFWYSSCRPCLMSIPHLCELQRLYQPFGLEVVGLAYESGTRQEQVNKVRSTQGRFRTNYISLLGGGDSCPVRRQFDVQSFPSAVLVDDKGDVVWRSRKGEGIDRRALSELEIEIRRRLGIR